jgi:Tfp pilus assembly PilM family ATPase
MAVMLENFLKSFLSGFGKNFRSRRVVAADFDSRFVYLVHAEPNGDSTRFLRLCRLAIPTDLNFADPQAVGQFLAQALKESGMAGCQLVMSVPRGQAVLKSLSLPAGLAQGELAGMVQYQVEKELPFRVEEAVVDFTVESHCDPAGAQGTGENGIGTNVLVAAVRLPVVDYYRQLAIAAGARLGHLGLRPYANIECLSACNPSAGGNCLVLVQVGWDETEIDVLVGPSLAFSRSAVVKMVSPGDAPGDAPSQAGDNLPSLVVEVTRSLQSYQSVQGGGKIESILVAGATGIEGELVKELAVRLGVPCQVVNPAKSLGLLDDGISGAFTCAIGLAVGHCTPGKRPFDFVHPKRPVVRRDKRKLKLAMTVGCGAALLMFCIAAGGMYLSQKKQAYTDLLRTYNNLNAQSIEIKSIDQKVTASQKWSNVGKNWLAHWANISVLFPPCQDVYIKGQMVIDDGGVKFAISARNDDVVASLGKNLEQAGYNFARGRDTNAKDPFGFMFNTDVHVTNLGKVDASLSATKPAPVRPADDASDDPSYKPPGKTSPKPASPPARAPAVRPSPAGQPAPASGPASAGQPMSAVQPPDMVKPAPVMIGGSLPGSNPAGGDNPAGPGRRSRRAGGSNPGPASGQEGPGQ